jgi:hypothetical protein
MALNMLALSLWVKIPVRQSVIIVQGLIMYYPPQARRVFHRHSVFMTLHQTLDQLFGVNLDKTLYLVFSHFD